MLLLSLILLPMSMQVGDSDSDNMQEDIGSDEVCVIVTHRHQLAQYLMMFVCVCVCVGAL